MSSDITTPFSPGSTTGPFLVLDENRFAFAAAETLFGGSSTKTPRLAYIHGPSGVGKSHLARWFSQELRRRIERPKYVHITAAEFAADFAKASVDRSIPEFQAAFTNLDALIFEDLQAIQKRPETQQQITAILDNVTQAGGCVLVTCRMLPGELKSITPRIISRCRQGITAEISLPEKNSRCQLIEQFAAKRQLALPPDVAAFLAESLSVSPRELLSAVLNLEARSRLANSVIDRSLAEESLRDGVGRPVPELKQIVSVIARQFGVRVSSLRHGTRQVDQVLPRQCAMFLARELTTHPLRHIADYFGGRNHSTALHACNKVRQLIEQDAGLRQQLNQARRSLTQN
jgi:chromosomal replication initiator protein